MKHLVEALRGRFGRASIRFIMFASFTISAVLAVLLTGMTLYVRFSAQLDSTIEGENQMLVEQVNQALGTYLRDMIRLSDSLYYNVIKSTALSDPVVPRALNLLYNTYSDYIENIAVFSGDGALMATAPPAKLREDRLVTAEPWFRAAMERTENLHFGAPMVQRLFAGEDDRFPWIISLSCAVELTQGKETETGVLLINLKYGPMAQILSGVKLSGTGYVYLTNPDGNIIYHPKNQSIVAGLLVEDTCVYAGCSDGIYREQEANGNDRSVIVRGVGYTGWKVIGVVDQTMVSMGDTKDILFVVVIFCLFFALLILMNGFLTKLLTDPVQRLEASVRALERDGKIYIGGAVETRRLGLAIQRMVGQLRRLTDDIVREHELKQKSELNALQAQINPHFLYNTLDIIVWMIENGQRGEAVRAVTALARFFRLSLARGRNIITVRDELEHVRNYLLIQEMRYKNKFRYEIRMDPLAEQLSTIKLVVQPIVENAIYHGMDFMDGDGLIEICAQVEGGILTLSVLDNGLGMTPQVVTRLLTGPTDTTEGTRRGSGIGLKNVQDRIRLYFGSEYGVTIESEPDEGTRVLLRMPAIPYGQLGDD